MKIITKGGDGFMKLYRSVAYCAELTAIDKLIWCIISDKCDALEHFQGKRWITLSITELAKEIGVSRGAALRAVQRLNELGLIERQQSQIKGYADSYTVPDQDIVDAIISGIERYGA